MHQRQLLQRVNISPALCQPAAAARLLYMTETGGE